MRASTRAAELRQRIVGIKDAEKYALDANAFEHVRAELQHHRTALQPAIVTVKVLVANERLDASDLPPTRKLDDSVKKITEAFAAEPGSITKGRGLGTVLAQLEAVRKEMAVACDQAWKVELSTAPKTNETLLAQIAKVRGQADVVRQLRAATSQLAQVSARPPRDAEEWLRYQTLRRSVEEQVKALSTTQFPKAVLEFCIAAQSEGATVSMLTDEVRAWLESHGMVGDLRYRFAK
jgi:hypothetical protein